MAVADSLAAYMDEMARWPLLDAEEERRLAQAGRRGDRAARARLVETNLRLVIHVAKSYWHSGNPQDFLDLIQAGNVGLLQAVDQFDPDRGTRFSTYATWWIRQAVREEARRLAGERREDGWGSAALSLEAPLGDGDTALEELLGEPEDAVAVEEAALRAALREELADYLRAIRPRERRLLELRFGLLDGRPRTLRETGELLGISAERARQLEAHALDRLRAEGIEALAAYVT